MTKNKRDNTHSLKMDKKLEELEKRTPLSTDPQQELEGRNSKLDTGHTEERPRVKFLRVNSVMLDMSTRFLRIQS